MFRELSIQRRIDDILKEGKQDIGQQKGTRMLMPTKARMDCIASKRVTAWVEETKPVGGDDAKARVSRGEQEQEQDNMSNSSIT